MIHILSNQRVRLGGMENSLKHSLYSLNVALENMSDAESLARDMDIANGLMDFTKDNIIIQSSQATVEHACHAPEGVLKLLR